MGKIETTVQKEELRKKRSKKIKIALFVLLNAAVIGYTAFSEFAKNGNGAEKFKNLKLNMLFLIGAFGCIAVAVFAEVFKYSVMMWKTCGRVSFKTAFSVCILGKYYDNITPSGIGGQPFQIYFLKKEGLDEGTSTALPVFGFLSMQFAFAAIALIVFIFGKRVIESAAVRIAAYFGLCFYLFIPLALVFFTIAPRAADKISSAVIRFLAKIHIVKNPINAIENTIETLRKYRDSIIKLTKYKYSLIMLVILPSLIYQISLCSIPWFVVSAFGAKMSWAESFCVCIYLYSAISFIPTPGNAGAAEGTFYAMFSALTTGYIFWAMLVWRFLCYYIFLIMGIGFYALRALKNRKNAKLNKINEAGTGQ